MEHVIYKLTSPSGKIYIGRTNNFKNRMKEHKYEGGHDRRDTPIYRAIKKYGWGKFDKEIIAECKTEEDAIDMERVFIVKYDTIKSGYNCHDNTERGGNVWSYKTEEELNQFREKMSELVSGENNGMYGRKHKKESIEKQKKKAKGRFSLPWYIDRHGEEEGTKLYEERCQRLSQRRMNRDENGKFT